MERKSIKDTLSEASSTVKSIVDKTKGVLLDKKDAIVDKLDQNGDGEFDITDIIILSFKSPGIRVNRDTFLRNELYKNHTQETIDEVIRSTPMKAGISSQEIDKIANEVINFERNCVTGISTALGIPGGWAMAATIPADIIQYYGYTLRAAQKLLYLYGFPEIVVPKNDLLLDTETINTIILCLGVMNGVAGANNAIKAMAKALAIGVEKKLLNTALTKGAFYPFVKAVMKWFGVRLTKATFAGFFKKAIPMVGGVVGGGLTFLTFKPCCMRLRDVLSDTMLSNPDHISSVEEDTTVGVIITGDESFHEIQEGVSGGAEKVEESTEDNCN
jgi:uncharacterized membrane protein